VAIHTDARRGIHKPDYSYVLRLSPKLYTTQHGTDTMAATVQLPPPAPSIHGKHGTHSIQECPACGTSIQLDSGEVEMARRKIVELEAQMEFLKEKATAAGM
jgi:hypothetical protein